MEVLDDDYEKIPCSHSKHCFGVRYGPACFVVALAARRDGDRISGLLLDQRFRTVHFAWGNHRHKHGCHSSRNSNHVFRGYGNQPVWTEQPFRCGQPGRDQLPNRSQRGDGYPSIRHQQRNYNQRQRTPQEVSHRKFIYYPNDWPRSLLGRYSKYRGVVHARNRTALAALVEDIRILTALINQQACPERK